MTKSLTRINQEIQRNLEQFEELRVAADKSYQSYLEQLGQILRYQLVLAAYQICTRHYPEAFLALSHREQTQLQQHLQQLGHQVCAGLPKILTKPYNSDIAPQQSLRSELLRRLPITPEQLQALKEKLLRSRADDEDDGDKSDRDRPKSDDDEPIVIAIDSEQLESMLSEQTESEKSTDASEPQSLPEMMASLAAIAKQSLAQQERTDPPRNSDTAKADAGEADNSAVVSNSSEHPPSEPSESSEQLSTAEESEPAPPDIDDISEPMVFEPPRDPVVYLRWSQNVETLLQDRLKALSMQANQALRQSKILPKKLPSKLFAAAIEAEESGNSNPTVAPNTMNLIVEADLASATDSDSETNNILSVTAIRLRLAEIEIADSTLSAMRSRIRERLAQLKTLARDYKKLSNDKAIAQAEAAWRSAWYEEPAPATSESD